MLLLEFIMFSVKRSGLFSPTLTSDKLERSNVIKGELVHPNKGQSYLRLAIKLLFCTLVHDQNAIY